LLVTLHILTEEGGDEALGELGREVDEEGDDGKEEEGEGEDCNEDTEEDNDDKADGNDDDNDNEEGGEGSVSDDSARGISKTVDKLLYLSTILVMSRGEEEDEEEEREGEDDNKSGAANFFLPTSILSTLKCKSPSFCSKGLKGCSIDLGNPCKRVSSTKVSPLTVGLETLVVGNNIDAMVV